MKATTFFYAGLAIDAIALVLAIPNLFYSSTSFKGIDGQVSPVEGMTNIGRVVTWLIPAVLLALILAASWLKSQEKIRLANILLWIPAFPLAAGIVIWGGLAILFNIASLGK